jgi:hypothetical protein
MGSTGAEMDALSSEMKTLEDSLADARAKLAAQAAKVEETLEAKLTAGLAGLNGKVDTEMKASRAEVEGKVSGDMSALSKQIGEASDASKASAQKLDDKVHEVQTAAEGVAAATSSQVASVQKDHAAFETQASQTLAHVETSLASTKVRLCFRLWAFPCVVSRPDRVGGGCRVLSPAWLACPRSLRLACVFCGVGVGGGWHGAAPSCGTT